MLQSGKRFIVPEGIKGKLGYRMIDQNQPQTGKCTRVSLLHCLLPQGAGGLAGPLDCYTHIADLENAL